MNVSRNFLLCWAFSCTMAAAQGEAARLSLESRNWTNETVMEPYGVWQVAESQGLLDGSHRSIVIRRFHVQPTSQGREALAVEAEAHLSQQPKPADLAGIGSGLLADFLPQTEEAATLAGAVLLALGTGPVGTPDRYVVPTDRTLSIAPPGFLANDIDLNSEALTAVSIQDNVDHGILAAFANGSFTYTPNPGFTGTDSFAYRMRDASNNFSDPVTVMIEVLPPANRTPVGTPDAYGALADTTLSIAAPGFLANDIDQDGEVITAVSIQDNVDHGILAAFANGSFTYTPNPGFIGTDSFAYRMRDASNHFSDPVTVTIEVVAGNRAPLGVPDGYAAVINTPLSIAAPGFLANDVDLDGEAITAVSIQDNVDNGTLAAFADGSFTYTPNPGFTGTDSFAYRMRDASNHFSDPITVTITVFPPGVIPVGTPDLYLVPADRTLSIATPGFLANDIDLNGEALTAVSIQDNVDHGTLAAFADGSFTYVPNPGFTGTDSFAYRMRDASNNFSDPVTVTIEVLPAANRTPIGTPDAYAALADTTLSIAALGFLANDIDPDGEAITAVSIQDNVDNGTLAAFADGSFTYTPNPGFTGTDSFAYRMRDASNHFSDPVKVTIEVFAGNRAPIGVPDRYAAVINTPLSIAAPGFLANDVDLDGEAITAVSIQDNVDNGTLAAFADGSFTYTPNPGFSGTDSFAYRMRDASNHFSDPIAVVITVLDPAGTCVNNLTARSKAGKIQLTWTYTGVHHYNVYRGTIDGGPYLKIGATTSTYSTYLDTTVVNGTTYYYVVREADSLGQEQCESNQASAKASPR
jgi:hypothetical protein